MNTREENERIREKNRRAAERAYENMNAALHGSSERSGVNAVLKFLNERERVDTRLPLSEQLEQIDEQLSIKTRRVTLDKDWYTTAVIPMLVMTADGEWLAVIPSPGGSCSYINKGKSVRVTHKNAGMFTTEAVYFYKAMGNGNITMRRMASFMVKCISKREAAAVTAASVLTIFAGMLLPWVNSFIFSKIIPAGVPNGISAAAALMFSAVMAAAVLGLLQSLVLTNSMLRCCAYMQSAVFSRLLSLKPEFFRNIRSGELSGMIMEFSDISKIVSVKSISAFINMLLSFIYLFQIYIYAPQLLIWVILSSVLIGGIMAAEGLLNARWTREYAKSLSGMAGFCYELFSGMEQVKLCGCEARMMRRWSEYYLDISKKEDKPFFLKYSDVFRKIIKIFTTAAIFIFGAGLSASDYIAFSAAYGAYAAAGTGAAVIIRMIAGLRSSYTLIKPMLNAECEDYGSGKKCPDSFAGEISVSDVYFKYSDDGPYVLKGISAHIRPCESVGIIGSSGCGKSTLIRLLLGFGSAERGSIYIDGFDIRELDLKKYRQKIGTVLQNTGLISGDIYSNITVTKPDASMEEVNKAIEMAGLTDTIAALPMGVHTPVSQENCTLSGGERQRVLIARAIISRPSVLIFDEATSALDNITQARITKNVNSLNCTKIIVAHRLSTIKECDKIMVIDKGVIVQEGAFCELQNTEGPFRQLMKKQQGGSQDNKEGDNA